MNEQPTPLAYSSAELAHIRHTNKLKLVWGIICLTAPTALFLTSLLAYAVINFIFGSGSVTSSGITDNVITSPTPIGITISNIILFVTGVISVTTWLPGIVGGIILLTTRKKI